MNLSLPIALAQNNQRIPTNSFAYLVARMRLTKWTASAPKITAQTYLATFDIVPPSQAGVASPWYALKRKKKTNTDERTAKQK
jgi:hypothetical protein